MADVAGAGPARRLLRGGTTLLAVLVVGAVLVTPQRLLQFTPLAFLRIPVEGLVLVGLALLLPARRVRVVAGIVGVLLGVLAIVRVLDLGFREALHRPVNLITDWRLVPPGLSTLRDSVGSRLGRGRRWPARSSWWSSCPWWWPCRWSASAVPWRAGGRSGAPPPQRWEWSGWCAGSWACS